MEQHNHLTDDQIVELCLSGAQGPPCAACDARLAGMTALLHDVSEAGLAAADAAFPAERLARQHARILHRLELDGRPARVLTFPGHGPEPLRLRARPATRWIAGAAAAGLIIGAVAGHLAHDVPVASAPVLASRPQPSTLQAVAVAAPFSEDEFLGQIELAADSPGGMALRPLHDLTPAAWDVK